MEAINLNYRHRLQDWQRISDYGARKIVKNGKTSVLTHYVIDPAQALNGKKIMFFSDLHWDQPSEVYHAFIEDINNYIVEFSPDILIFGGDLTTYACYLEEALQALATLNVPIKLAMPGNWEFRRRWISTERWGGYFAEAGFQLLCQQWFSTDGLSFFGVDDFKYGNPQPPKSYPAGFRIMLAHNPDAVILLSQRDLLANFGLILCGHTHGGQLRLPGFGALSTSSIYGTHLDYGHFRNNESKTDLLISSGLGYTRFKLRINCQPEVLLLTS
ncbi:MAG: metallophosphoesterase [Victivallaceae bacterium]|nr:metallophosphoesterase [Victivallaceae bacterium]